MEVGLKIYCIDESVYSEHITKRKEYVVENYINQKIRIKNNQHKLVWIPENCFVLNKIPEIISVTIDDRIDDSKSDCVDVTIEFSNGEKSWTTFITYDYLNVLLQSNKYLILSNFILIKELNEFDINEIISELDRKNELAEVIKSY